MEEFEVDDLFDGLPGPDYNVAPTVAVPAVFERRVKDTGEIRRRLAPLVWGLVPSWAKDASIGSRMINARLETVAEKPAFRRAFSTRRCLLPADGFYEWYAADPPDAPALGRGRGKPRKQPFFIHRSDGGLLVMAGIYEIWRDPRKDPDDDSAWLRTCSVITTEATDAAGHIHDRMPMVITREAIDAWLDPDDHRSEARPGTSRGHRGSGARGVRGLHRGQQRREQQSVACRADHRRGRVWCLIRRP